MRRAGPDLLSPLWSAPRLPALDARSWELLFAQARASRLMARLARLVESRGWWPQVPPAAARHLESAGRLAERLHHEVLWEVRQVDAALRSVDTPVVLLKGAAYLAAGLPPGRGRLFSDVDIMVARECLPAVEDALLAAGWIAQKLTPYDDRYYREWMHELPPLEHVHRRTFLDVHHTIAPPSSRFAIDGLLLLQALEPLPGEARLAVLAPADIVIHSAVHLLQEGEFASGLRDLLDLNDLLLHFTEASPDFWAGLLQRARVLGAGVPLHHALWHTARLFGTAPPPALAAGFDAIGPRGASRRLMRVLLTAALRPQHPSCESAGTSFARWLLYVRSHWLRMPWYQIAPHLLRKGWMRLLERHRPADATAASAARKAHEQQPTR